MYNGSRARFDKNGIRFGGNSHCGLILALLTLGGLGVSREAYSADSYLEIRYLLTHYSLTSAVIVGLKNR